MKTFKCDIDWYGLNGFQFEATDDTYIDKGRLDGNFIADGVGYHGYFTYNHKSGMGWRFSGAGQKILRDITDDYLAGDMGVYEENAFDEWQSQIISYIVKLNPELDPESVHSSSSDWYERKDKEDKYEEKAEALILEFCEKIKKEKLPAKIIGFEKYWLNPKSKMKAADIFVQYPSGQKSTYHIDSSLKGIFWMDFGIEVELGRTVDEAIEGFRILLEEEAPTAILMPKS